MNLTVINERKQTTEQIILNDGTVRDLLQHLKSNTTKI